MKELGGKLLTEREDDDDDHFRLQITTITYLFASIDVLAVASGQTFEMDRFVDVLLRIRFSALSMSPCVHPLGTISGAAAAVAAVAEPDDDVPASSK